MGCVRVLFHLGANSEEVTYERPVPRDSLILVPHVKIVVPVY